MIKTTMQENQAAKRAAGYAAAQWVQDGMIVGLGTGSTAKFFVEAVAERVQNEHLKLRCVPTSRTARAQAEQHGLPLVPLTEATRPDLTVDGADEVDTHLNLIKGGGGALMQEKLVAISSREMVVIADASKEVEALGKFLLPVAVVPFGWETTQARIVKTFEVEATLRQTADGHGPFVTDDGLYVVDLAFGRIDNPLALETRLKSIVGVAETGLFVGIAARVVFGNEDGTVREIRRPG